MFKKAKIKENNLKKGFTLVELLVTIVIFVIITGVVLVNSNKFDNTILLNNFGYDVALTIKLAQSYGVNVRESSSATFNYPYGVYFNLDTTTNSGGSLTNFVLFNDFDQSSSTKSVTSCDISSECIQKYSMQKGTYIKSLCAGTDEIDCNNHSNTQQLSILFQRPKLEALIYADGTADLKSYAKIILSSADGAVSTVIVTSAGQIYVKK